MLTKIWDFLFHRHDWQDIQTVEICTYIRGSERVIGQAIYQKCRKCGERRKIVLK